MSDITTEGLSLKASDWKDTAELLGITAIVASLVFVGLELKQGRDIAKAEVHQQRASLALQANVALNDPAVQSVIGKVISGDELSFGERLVVDGVFERMIIFYENNHFQHELGLLDDETWLASRKSLASDMTGSEAFIEFWKRDRENWRKSFADVVDDLIDQSDSR